MCGWWRSARVIAAAAAIICGLALAGAGRAVAAAPRRAAGAQAASGRDWGKAEQVPGLAALSAGGSTQLASVSCPSAGNCSAGGSYTDSSGATQAFVVTQASGRWGKAREVPGLGALNNPGGDAEIDSLSCGSAGNCSAGGFFTERSGYPEAFVVTQARGRWGKAREVPGLGALNTGSAQLYSLSCAPAGSCSAGGIYHNGPGQQAFIVSKPSY